MKSQNTYKKSISICLHSLIEINIDRNITPNRNSLNKININIVIIEIENDK